MPNCTSILHIAANHKEEEYDLRRFWSLESLGIQSSEKTIAEKSEEQERKGFIEKVSTNPGILSKVHYLPHHLVYKNSTTTLTRTIYDYSCRQSAQSPSLNDCLPPGPLLQNDITSILMRFRLQSYGVTTDIEKHFCM